MKKPLGIVIYDGASLLDGKKVIVVANGFKSKSENHKIGDMIQTWIIRKNINPLRAAKKGEDFSICGGCKHRKIRSCYVNLTHGPAHIYDAYHRGSYVRFELHMLNLFENRQLRMGSYGDPAAVPFEIWHYLCKIVRTYTGYTHSWRTCDQRLKQYCMASVESESELFEAQGMGWRTFRVRFKGDSLLPNEFVCPASIEGGKKTTCSECRACKGTNSRLKKCPIIILHGPSWKQVFYHRSIEQKK